MFCVFQEPSGGGYEEVIKELVRDSFGGDAFSVEEAVVLLRKNVAERDALKAENENLRRQLMDLVVDKAYMTRNDLLLRQELDDVRSGSEPNVLQLKQLLTEPAVNREFQRLSSLAKSASLEAAALREEIRAMHFVANDPKGPKALMAQVRSLETKCKSLSAEAAESKANSLETSLRASENKVMEWKKKYQILQEKFDTLLHDRDVLERELLTLRPRHAADSRYRPSQAKRGRGGRGRPHNK